jgi:putative pyruvate formate lyase activating enzyme
VDGDPAVPARGALLPVERTRVYWRGVTLLEEHEIAPTYEVYLAGCPLRCPFCALAPASRSTRVGERLDPEGLAEDLRASHHPPFRALAFVGGEPSMHLPWIRLAIPALRRRLPDCQLVLNTALCWDAALAPELVRRFDWVVGTVRSHGPRCAAALGAPPDYPAQARAAVEALLRCGGRVLLRLLAIPGHLDCCARPLAAWIAGLEGDLRARVMLEYAPLAEARGIPGLDRCLDEDSALQAASLLAPSVPRPRGRPVLPIPRRLDHHRDPPVPIEIDARGALVAPMVTGTILPLLAERRPALRERLAYLVPHAC